MNIPRPCLDHAFKAMKNQPIHLKEQKPTTLRRGKKWQNAMLAAEAVLEAIEKANKPTK